MKILLVGNVNSPFILEYASKLKEKYPEIKLEAFSTINYDESKHFTDSFDKIINPFSVNKWLFNLKIIGTILRVIAFKFFLKKTHSYDIIHLHFISYLAFYNINLLNKKSKKLISTIYGSDFYKISPYYSKKLLNVLKKSTIISCTNNQTKNEIKNRFVGLDNEIKVVRFGLTPLDFIDKYRTSYNSFNFLNVTDQSFIISCGYNSSKNLNHSIIIESLNKIKKSLPHNYLLVFQFSYGSSSLDYQKNLENKLKSYGLRYQFINRYLSNEEIAFLRLRTNLSIQLPNTDQFSGSIQEYVYSKSIVITGEWLPYNLLDKHKVGLQKIKSFEELPSKIEFCIANYDDLRVNITKNYKEIKKLSSWKENIPKWHELYCS